MTDQPKQRTWLSAIAEAAKLHHLELPPFALYGMGALRSATTASGRFVTLKRALGPAAKAKDHGVEWALWHEQNDVPVVVAIFRGPLEPGKESVALTLALLKGWLVDQWTPDVAKGAVSQHPGVQDVKDPPHRLAEEDLQGLSIAIVYEALGLPPHASVLNGKVNKFAPSPAFVEHLGRAVEAQAIASAPKNAFVAWERNGEKSTAQPATQKRWVDAVEYQTIA